MCCHSILRRCQIEPHISMSDIEANTTSVASTLATCKLLETDSCFRLVSSVCRSLVRDQALSHKNAWEESLNKRGTPMIRTSIAALAALVCCSSVHAEGVKVRLVGKDAPTIRSEIERAARSVCAEDARESPLYHPTRLEMAECVARSSEVALAKAGLPASSPSQSAKPVLIGAR